MSPKSLWQFRRAIDRHHVGADLRDFLAHSQQFRYSPTPEDSTERQRRVEQDRRREAACRQRAWLHDQLDGMEPASGQQSDTHLGPYIGLPALAKGKGVFTKVMQGDIQLAEKMAREDGRDDPDTIGKYLAAIMKVNALSTASYLGGDKIEKQGGGEVKKSKLAKRMKKAAEFVENYKMTGANPELDKAIFTTQYRAAQRIGQQPGQPVSSALGLLTAGRR